MENSAEKRGSVSIGLIQGKDFGSKQANLDFTLEQIRILAGQGAQVICTQELFNTNYFCNEQDPKHFDLAESIPGATSEIFSALAKASSVVPVLLHSFLNFLNSTSLIKFLLKGCSLDKAIKLAPKIVSGLVVKIFILSCVEEI